MTEVEAKMHAQCPVRYKTVRVNNQDNFRLVAPDYPGSGQRSMSDGGPISYRVALKHPEGIQALIVQNGNVHEEGLPEFWDWQRSDDDVPQLVLAERSAARGQLLADVRGGRAAHLRRRHPALQLP